MNRGLYGAQAPPSLSSVVAMGANNAKHLGHNITATIQAPDGS
jgi:hypothetical protein